MAILAQYRVVNFRAAARGGMWITFHMNSVELTPSQPCCKLGSKNWLLSFSFRLDGGEKHHFDAGLLYWERESNWCLVVGLLSMPPSDLWPRQICGISYVLSGNGKHQFSYNVWKCSVNRKALYIWEFITVVIVQLWTLNWLWDPDIKTENI